MNTYELGLRATQRQKAKEFSFSFGLDWRNYEGE
jgi:hypothetical protein